MRKRNHRMWQPVDAEAVQSEKRYCICGKLWYRSENRAARTLRYMRQRHHEGAYKGKLTIYFCQQGKGYHVGHTDRDRD